jgi:hypothetical protein
MGLALKMAGVQAISEVAMVRWAGASGISRRAALGAAGRSGRWAESGLVSNAAGAAAIGPAIAGSGAADVTCAGASKVVAAGSAIREASIFRGGVQSVRRRSGAT